MEPMRTKDKVIIILLSYLLAVAIAVIVYQSWIIGQYQDLMQSCLE